MSARKKCVIIGSGLGGLSCGMILSRNGYDITVLEQGAQIGGCLQCFTRNGARFETGMHF
ncbi:NAD(P)-binding protein, partial [uncultured Duncaniella sp.]|uniref:NAD(P)-binding protein n=1 Tax=uncultured Duncaniella sp. TaxID=2768039 RepID=UPI002670441E